MLVRTLIVFKSNNNNTMEKMYISFTKELRNIDFNIVFESLARILHNKNIDTPLTTKAAKRIKFHSKELLLLKHSIPDTRLTQIINEKLHLRTKYLASLRMEIKAKQITYLPEKRKAADRLMFWLDRYKKDLYKPSATIQSNLVNSMIDDRNKIPEIQQCITLLDLDGLLDEIKVLTDEVFEDRLQRSKEAERKRMLVYGLREEAYSDLELLVGAIKMDYKLATNEEKKEELASLSSLISFELKNMHAQLRSRRTRSKNRRAIKAAVEELIKTTYKPAPAQINLPLVNYNELRISNTLATPTSKPSQQAINKTTPRLKSNKTNKEIDKDSNTNEGENNSSTNRGEKKDGDDETK